MKRPATRKRPTGDCIMSKAAVPVAAPLLRIASTRLPLASIVVVAYMKFPGVRPMLVK